MFFKARARFISTLPFHFHSSSHSLKFIVYDSMMPFFFFCAPSSFLLFNKGLFPFDSDERVAQKKKKKHWTLKFIRFKVFTFNFSLSLFVQFERRTWSLKTLPCNSILLEPFTLSSSLSPSYSLINSDISCLQNYTFFLVFFYLLNNF